MFKVFLYIVCILCTSVFFSCIKQEKKWFDCECNYVADPGGPNAGQPNKIEAQAINAYNSIEALETCQQSNSKYNSNYYIGTCLIK